MRTIYYITECQSTSVVKVIRQTYTESDIDKESIGVYFSLSDCKKKIVEDIRLRQLDKDKTDIECIGYWSLMSSIRDLTLEELHEQC